jgi:hypothetical protein
MTVVLLVLGPVLFAVLPLSWAVVLVRQHDYVLSLFPVLYAFPYCLGIVIVARPLIRLIRLAARDLDAARSRVNSWTEKVKREAPTDEQYAEAKGLVWKLAYRVLALLHAIFILPTTFLKTVLGAWLGPRVAWWPDFDPLSYVLFTILSYLIAGVHHPAVGLAIGCYLLLIKLFEVLSQFETHRGVLRMLSYPKHQVGLSAIAFAALIIVAAFGCVHYCISLLNPMAYSQRLTAVDGLYFSTTTFATVGYGDIYPRTAASKLACVGEIASGCLVLVFGVSIAMAVWLQKFASAEPRPTSSSTARKPAETTRDSETDV